ncbi:Protein RKD3, partial [Tetrabaena socialis]
ASVRDRLQSNSTAQPTTQQDSKRQNGQLHTGMLPTVDVDRSGLYMGKREHPQQRSSGDGTQEGCPDVKRLRGDSAGGNRPLDSALGTCPILPSLAPMRSAFSQPLACLPAEWQPGCTVMTGRRSTRSPAPKAGRSVSLMRAASADHCSSPFSRRGSGLAAVADGNDSSTVNVIANNGSTNGDNSIGAPASGPWGANVAPESMGSADLRRLAQLAEAAAMLEEQLAPGSRGAGRGAARGPASGPGPFATSGRGVAAMEASSAAHRSGADAADHEPLPRQRTGPPPGAVPLGSGPAGSASAASGQGGSRDSARPQLFVAASAPSGGLPLRPLASLPMPMRMGESQPAFGAAALARARSSDVRQASPDPRPDAGGLGSSYRDNQDSDAVSGGSEGNDRRHLNEDGDDDGGDGSGDSGAGGSSGGGRSLTERYRAALKASAAEKRGRTPTGAGGKLDSDKQRAVRNGVCARIASITKDKLQQVYHLNIEEAARELGIGMTKLKEHCRTLGIPRWPSRKLKSMDKLIESLNERASTEPATKEVIADILAEIESFKRAIYENPCLEVEEDIKRLRQSNFKKEYQQRQVEQRNGRNGSVERLPGRPSHSSGSGDGAADDFPGAGGSALPPALGAGLGPALSCDQGSAQLMQVQLAQMQAAQSSAEQLPLHPAVWQHLAAIGGLPPQNLLMPSVLAQQLQQQQLPVEGGAL